MNGRVIQLYTAEQDKLNRLRAIVRSTYPAVAGRVIRNEPVVVLVSQHLNLGGYRGELAKVEDFCCLYFLTDTVSRVSLRSINFAPFGRSPLTLL